jgi:Tfp pilus assembly protein PilX
MIHPESLHRSQRGAALIVCLILLVLITAMVTSSFTLSSTNLKSVTNTQIRNEAIAAANTAIEQVLSSPFYVNPTAESVNVDINNDGTTDYTVTFAAPRCLSVGTLTPASLPVSSVSLGSSFASTVSTYYETIFDLDATVIDNASGASVRVHQGVRKLLTQAQYTAACP